MSDQVQRYLKTEELYREVLDLVCDTVFEEKGETYVRGKLDAILSQGKIEVRMAALKQSGVSFEDATNDPLIGQWTRIVESVRG